MTDVRPPLRSAFPAASPWSPPSASARRSRIPGRRLAALLVPIALVAAAIAEAGAQQPPVRRPPVSARRPAVPAPKPVADSAAAAKADSAAADTIPYTSITGVVYDSVHASPLGDATVSVDGTTRMAVTNRLGLFQIDSVPPGEEYRVRVQHVLLDSIGLQMVTQPFSLGPDDSPTMQLAIPSPSTLVEVSCPAARRALGPAAVIGRLLDADTDAPVEGARVSVAWLEMSINAGLRKIPRVREALSGADGVYRICGLPSALEGTLQAQHKGVTTSEVRVNFAGEALVVQGLKIGSAATVVAATGDAAELKRQKDAATGPQFSAVTLQTGSAKLTGRVINAAGQPVVGARVDVLGTPAATLTRENGEFALDSLPSGTQSLVVRQIGFAPEERAVELSTRGPASIEVKMDRPATVLSTVVVKADRDVGLERVGFAQRRRSGGGHYITGDDVVKRAPNVLTDVFRTVPGLRVSPAGNGIDYVIESSRNVAGGCVRYWVDGAVFEAVFPGDVDRLVPPWEIAAIEVYNGISVPAQFQAAGNTSCAAIVIWTKTRTDRPGSRR